MRGEVSWPQQPCELQGASAAWCGRHQRNREEEEGGLLAITNSKRKAASKQEELFVREQTNGERIPATGCPNAKQLTLQRLYCTSETSQAGTFMTMSWSH